MIVIRKTVFILLIVTSVISNAQVELKLKNLSTASLELTKQQVTYSIRRVSKDALLR